MTATVQFADAPEMEGVVQLCARNRTRHMKTDRRGCESQVSHDDKAGAKVSRQIISTASGRRNLSIIATYRY